MAISVRERNELVEQWIYLPKYVIKTKLNRHPALRGLGRDDAISLGYMALIKAAELYDPKRGVKFNTYAVTAIRNYILQYSRDTLSIIHIPLYHFDRKQSPSAHKFKDFVTRALRCGKFPCEEKGVSRAPKNEPIEWDKDCDYQSRLDWMRQALTNLPSRDELVLRRRFLEGKTLIEVGEELGCTKENARLIQRRALEVLRGSLKEKEHVGPS